MGGRHPDAGDVRGRQITAPGTVKSRVNAIAWPDHQPGVVGDQRPVRLEDPPPRVRGSPVDVVVEHHAQQIADRREVLGGAGPESYRVLHGACVTDCCVAAATYLRARYSRRCRRSADRMPRGEQCRSNRSGPSGRSTCRRRTRGPIRRRPGRAPPRSRSASPGPSSGEAGRADPGPTLTRIRAPRRPQHPAQLVQPQPAPPAAAPVPVQPGPGPGHPAPADRSSSPAAEHEPTGTGWPGAAARPQRSLGWHIRAAAPGRRVEHRRGAVRLRLLGHLGRSPAGGDRSATPIVFRGHAGRRRRRVRAGPAGRPAGAGAAVGPGPAHRPRFAHGRRRCS